LLRVLGATAFSGRSGIAIDVNEGPIATFRRLAGVPLSRSATKRHVRISFKRASYDTAIGVAADDHLRHPQHAPAYSILAETHREPEPNAECLLALTEDNVVAQLKNLRSHPTVATRLEKGDLALPRNMNESCREKVVKLYSWGATISGSNSQSAFVDHIAG
jgi:hypothetical protein